MKKKKKQRTFDTLRSKSAIIRCFVKTQKKRTQKNKGSNTEWQDAKTVECLADYLFRGTFSRVEFPIVGKEEAVLPAKLYEHKLRAEKVRNERDRQKHILRKTYL